METHNLEITWFGHSTFRLVTAAGTAVIIDPWVMGNPACPDSVKQLDRLDIMLLTHGHSDHIGDAVELALRHDPDVVGIYELCLWMQGKGCQKIHPMNKGGSLRIRGLTVTMVHADHSSGILEDGKLIYGGEPVGYVIELADGFKLYHAGDTGLFGDMRLIGDLYQPDIAILPVGDLFTMGPREAAVACRLLGSKRVIPMHHGTFPPLTGTPAQLAALVKELPNVEVLVLKPGETRNF